MRICNMLWSVLVVYLCTMSWLRKCLRSMAINAVWRLRCIAIYNASNMTYNTYRGDYYCFLQVGIPHFCKTFSPAPVGKIKLT